MPVLGLWQYERLVAPCRLFAESAMFSFVHHHLSCLLLFTGGIAFALLIQFVPHFLHQRPSLKPQSLLPWREHLHPAEEAALLDTGQRGNDAFRNLFDSKLDRAVSRKFTDSQTNVAEALAALNVALEMRSQGKQDKAQRLFEHAFALHPTHPDILNHYGEFIEEHEKNVIQAEHLYSKALLVCPYHSRAASNRQRTLPQVEEQDQSLLRRIDAKRNQLMSVPDSSPAFRRIKKEAYFQQIYHTVGIEGNTMTLAETRTIVETKLAVGGKSIMEHNEIIGLDAALSFINSTLVQKLGAITVQDVLEIHRRVMGYVDPIEAGMFRQTQVFVGEHVPPHPTEVQMLMNEFIEWLNSVEALQLHPIKYAALAHYRLVYIHPFTDGNGRTSRLLMNMILMQAGFPPVIVRKQDRLQYYQYLETANEGDVRPFIRFIADCTERTLDVYLYATKEYGKQESPALAITVEGTASPVIQSPPPPS